ncbi:hypothetical protein MMC20_007795 [Loxospora ochrophaea]|nr:hypothetical protein [Loxospora ochrophaea]
MAYNALAQAEHDLHSQSTDSDFSPSPPPAESAFQPLPLDVGDRHTQMPESTNDNRLSSMINSMIPSRPSYEMVEDDDYEDVHHDVQSQDQTSPSADKTARNMETISVGSRQSSIRMPRPQSPEGMVRTISRESSGPLRHPTPDLQSLQGAYVGNVERLERHAERLSLSSDIGEELRKIRQEQKRSESRRSSVVVEEGRTRPSMPRQLSTSSNASNSIMGLNSIARSGGFSPGGYITSPVGSFRSFSWSQRPSQGPHGSRVSRLTQSYEPGPDGSRLGLVQSSASAPLPSERPLRVTNQNATPSPEQSGKEFEGVAGPFDRSQHNKIVSSEDVPERPGTSASHDTYRQATNLFADFDGVHITPHRQNSITAQTTASRRVSLSRPPLADGPESYTQPPSGENMVFYPAPVPMMLNLPQKLSKNPSNMQRDKRRSQALNQLTRDARKSAAWLPGLTETGDEEVLGADRPSSSKRKTLEDLPPQLRASVFFDHPSVSQAVELKGDSAVATLDSILDASAHAPVSAFTDHPIAGNLGTEVYGSRNAQRSSSDFLRSGDYRKSRGSMNLFKNRKSTANFSENVRVRNTSSMSLGATLDVTKRDSLPLDSSRLDNLDSAYATHDANGRSTDSLMNSRTDFHGDNEDNGDIVDDQAFHDAQEELSEGQEEEWLLDEAVYQGPPTTLLAELQLRKQEQKQRNRTAATAFPNGMHSTLLELDAVAQVQERRRKKKHIKLAWEPPDDSNSGAEQADDEDVPLGVLYPRGKLSANINSGRFDDERPLGLIAQRAMEDNEPLSQRRSRLRGPYQSQPNPDPKRESVYTLNVPGIDDIAPSEDVEEDGETLAQRLKRLKDKKEARNRPIGGDFASEVMSQFGGLPETVPASKTPDAEETLGQRRKRLQAEREAKSREVSGGTQDYDKPEISKRRSLADILQAHPVTDSRSAPNETQRGPVPNEYIGGADKSESLLHQHQQLQLQKREQLANKNRMSSFDVFAQRDAGLESQRPQLSMNHRASVGNLPTTSGFGTVGRHPYQNFDAAPQVTGITQTHAKTMGYNSIAYGNSFAGPTPYGGTAPHNSTSILPMAQEAISLDPKQRDMIDRWRQSVLH